VKPELHEYASASVNRDMSPWEAFVGAVEKAHTLGAAERDALKEERDRLLTRLATTNDALGAMVAASDKEVERLTREVAARTQGNAQDAALIRRLREALRPFAVEPMSVHPEQPDDEEVAIDATIGDVRRARAALSEGGEGET